MQITGQPSVLYFAQKLFQDAGFSLKDAGGKKVIVLALGMIALVQPGASLTPQTSRYFWAPSSLP